MKLGFKRYPRQRLREKQRALLAESYARLMRQLIEQTKDAEFMTTTKPTGEPPAVNPPKRIQLSRKKGWKKPVGAVVVSRPGNWGNPFKVGPERSQREAVGAFRTWLSVAGVHAGIPERKQWMTEHLSKLRGKDLACWCKLGEPCHADVLLEIANAEEASG